MGTDGTEDSDRAPGGGESDDPGPGGKGPGSAGRPGTGSRDAAERGFLDGSDGLFRILRLPRDWFPVPVRGQGVRPVRWLLLDGNRHAVTGALLTLVFASILLVGTVWTLEMQRLLVETPAVQTLLNTLLSGIILLVSIVVSINSVVLSYDIASLGTQRERIEKALEFRSDLGKLTDTERSPTEPDVFLDLMVDAIEARATRLQEAVDDREDAEFAREIREFTDALYGTVEQLDEYLDHAGSYPFAVLWLGIEFDYGSQMDRSLHVRLAYRDQFSEDVEERFESLVEVLRLFATGREYFKTLYYSREFSQLSQTLLVVSLPAIVVTASAILAINAELLPTFTPFGLPPLLTFVAATFTVSLLPFVVLTAFMLRAATVAKKTLAAGPFVLQS